MNRPGCGRRWLPLNALRAFEGVARQGGFTAAANALLISQSALSRHVLSLEALVGTQLFERRPHGLQLTRAGEHLLPAVTRSLDALDAALAAIRDEAAPPRRTLRVQLPPSFAARQAIPILQEFRRASGGVEIDLVSPCGSGLPAADVDVAVIYARPVVTHLVADLLWPVRLRLMCHPAVAARHAGKDLARFLADNELIHVRLSDQPRHHLWAQFLRQAGIPTVNVERGLVFDTAVMAVQYALGGEGVALVDERLFAEETRSGRLVRPFENALDDGYGYYLLTPPETLGDTPVGLFRSWLIERVAQRPALAEQALREVARRKAV